MTRISVKAVQGRVARTSPTGPFIPHDRFIMVDDTNYIRRLLDVHGDIVLEPAPKAKAKSHTSPVTDKGADQPDMPQIPAPTKKE